MHSEFWVLAALTCNAITLIYRILATQTIFIAYPKPSNFIHLVTKQSIKLENLPVWPLSSLDTLTVPSLVFKL